MVEIEDAIRQALQGATWPTRAERRHIAGQVHKALGDKPFAAIRYEVDRQGNEMRDDDDLSALLLAG